MIKLEWDRLDDFVGLYVALAASSTVGNRNNCVPMVVVLGTLINPKPGVYQIEHRCRAYPDNDGSGNPRATAYGAFNPKAVREIWCRKDRRPIKGGDGTVATIYVGWQTLELGAKRS